jgi:hypothetical protein
MYCIFQVNQGGSQVTYKPQSLEIRTKSGHSFVVLIKSSEKKLKRANNVYTNLPAVYLQGVTSNDTVAPAVHTSLSSATTKDVIMMAPVQWFVLSFLPTHLVFIFVIPPVKAKAFSNLL